MPRALLVLLGFGLATPLAAQTHSPYAGAAPQEIKALSPAEIADLQAGRGMGLARPAELNGYPGPMHVLELAEPLGLSAAQRAASTAIMTRMREAATALGAQIVDAERALDRAFADNTIDPQTLQAQTASIASLQGRLRAVHLAAHLEQRALLAAAQIERYMSLRGYAAAHSHHPK
jgi:Spy/CpxP family protein refolding chaperone